MVSEEVREIARDLRKAIITTHDGEVAIYSMDHYLSVAQPAKMLKLVESFAELLEKCDQEVLIERDRDGSPMILDMVAKVFGLDRRNLSLHFEDPGDTPETPRDSV